MSTAFRAPALPELMAKARAALDAAGVAAPGQAAAGVAFFTFGDGTSRARTLCATGEDWQSAWQAGAAVVLDKAKRSGCAPSCLRVDVVDHVEPTTWGALKLRLAGTKRNYFGHGISFDEAFGAAFLAQELDACGALYDNAFVHAQPNAAPFLAECQKWSADWS